MEETTFTFTDAQGEKITAYRWAGTEPARVIVQVAHGMGEHALRYRRLAEALVGAGAVVYANDHRGHGATAGSPEGYGHLGEGGWDALVGGVVTLGDLAREEQPGLPLVAFGHSMGSFALQCVLLDHSDRLTGAVLSGTTAVDVIAAALDPSQPADLTAFNAPFEPARTPYDWLSRDPDEVDKYVADPGCGFGVDAEGMAGLVARAPELADPERLSHIRVSLPILIQSGVDDPLAGGGSLVELVADRYRAAGVQDVQLELYPGARHEIYNETNRDAVTADLLAWLDRVLAAG